MKIKLNIIFLIFFTLFPSFLFSEEENYSHIIVLGGDQTISNSETNKFNPVVSYYYNFLEEKDNWFGQFYLSTTNIKITLGHNNEKYSAGIIPQFNHTIYGGYYLYDRGVFFENRTFAGHKAGIEFFYEYSFIEILKMKLAYLPDYHFYQKLKKSNPLYGVKEETEIDLPADHWQHNIIGESSLGKIKSTDLDRIHHGIILKAKYQLTKRVGWETYNDIDPVTREGEVSNETVLHRFYLNLGAYYNISGYNLLLDFNGSIQKNIDRTDSEQIGSLVAERAVVPGYFFGEFLHNKYFFSWGQFGIPFPFWNTRVQPGFAVLYITEENEVIGVGDYPKEIYRSITFNVSSEMFEFVPVFFYYAYGIDAERINVSDNTKKKGNHEILLYVLAAF